MSLLINFSIAKGAGLHLINDQLAYDRRALSSSLLNGLLRCSRLAAADSNPPFLKLMESYARQIEILSQTL